MEFVGTPPVISYAIVTKDIEPWHRCKFAWISTNAKKLQVYVGGVDALILKVRIVANVLQVMNYRQISKRVKI